MTLVEMLIALLILGVVLTAVAVSLTGFSRQAVANERRVQATAHLSQLHEQLQALDWERAALYDTEVDGDLQDIAGDVDGLDFAGSLPTFEGEPLVLTPIEIDGVVFRDEFVPAPVDDDPDAIDGRSFQRIITLVTWATDDPSVVGNVPLAKRFVTIVSWEVLGRTYTQRFDSLRAPTAGDIASTEPPEIVSLDVSPSVVPIDQDGKSDTTIGVVVKFSRGVDQVSVTYPCYGADGNSDDDGFATGDPGTCDLVLTDTALPIDGRPTQFSGEISLDADKIWVRGAETLTISGTIFGLDPITTNADVTFIDALTLTAPTVSSVLVSPTNVETERGNRELCSTITVTATIDGLLTDGTVTVSYPVDSGVGRQMTQTGSNTWQLVFAEGTTSPWQPNGNQTATITFTVTATNLAGEESFASSPVSSNTLMIRQRPGGQNSDCP